MMTEIAVISAVGGACYLGSKYMQMVERQTILNSPNPEARNVARQIVSEAQGMSAAKKMLLIVGFAAYLISPVDLVPDIFFPLGYGDDAALGYWLYNVINRKPKLPDDQRNDEPPVDAASL